MKTAFSGPIIVYGDRNPQGAGGSSNSDKAPSVFWGGIGIYDHRAGYNRTRQGAIGVWSQMAVDAVPAALSATNIAAAQSVTAGTAMTLAGASTGITVLSSGLQVWASGNTVPSGALVLDGNPALLSFGQASLSSGATSVSYYDPSTMLARNVRVTTNADDTGGFYTVVGYDVYGYSVSEKITGVNAGVAAGKKAFKFIVSVTPSGTINSTSVSVGTGDVFGFPLRADTLAYTEVVWNSGFGTSTTTPFGTASAYTFADTNTATQTTGDTRGTIYVGTANPSNGTRRLQISIVPAIKTISSSGSTTALFGVTQA
jgi:hypothetical protein